MKNQKFNKDMNAFNLPSQLVLHLSEKELSSLVQLLHHALECSGWLRTLLVVGENKEWCEKLRESWYISGKNGENSRNSHPNKEPNKSVWGDSAIALAGVEVKTHGLEADRSSASSLAIATVAGVEAGIIALSSHLNVWIQVEPWGNEAEDGKPEQWQHQSIRVSVVFDAEAIADLLAIPEVAAISPYCSGIQAFDLENDRKVLRRFWLQLVNLVRSQPLTLERVLKRQKKEATSKKAGSTCGSKTLKENGKPLAQGSAKERSPLPLPELGSTRLFWDCPMGIVYNSIDGGILNANPAFCQMTGYSPTQLRHLDSRSISHPEDFAAQVRLIQQMLKEGLKRESLRKRYICANGSILACEETICLVGEEVEESAFISFVSDTSDRAKAELEIQQRRYREVLLSSISAKIRASFDLPTILQLGVEGLREALGIDRAVAVQFLPDGSSLCIAEDVDLSYPSLQGQWFPAECVPSQYRDAYSSGRVGAISDIHSPSVSECHRQMLEKFQVRSLMAAAIVGKESGKVSEAEDETVFEGIADRGRPKIAPKSTPTLRGLLVVHHCHAPRRWTSDEEQLLQAVANQMAIAIEQLHLVEQLRTYARKLEERVQQRTESLERSLQFEQLIRHLTETLRNAPDENTILDVAVEGIVETLGVYSCHAGLFDDRQQMCQIRTSFCQDNRSHTDSDSPALVGTQFSLDRLSQVCQERLFNGEICQECWNPDESWDPSTLSNPNSSQKILVPIADDRGTIGALWVVRPPVRCLVSSAKEQLLQVARVCAIGIRQARLLEEQQASRRSAEYFRSFLVESSDAFLEYDAQLRYLSINPAGASLFNLPPEKIVGKTNRELPGVAAIAIEPSLRQVCKTGDRLVVDCEINLPTGRRTFEMVYSPIADESGTLHRIVGIARDITEFRHQWQRLQEQNHQLAAINRLKEEFIATTSHELRTPLTAILGFSSVLLEESFGLLNGKQKVYVDRIHTSGQHLLSLINDILDLSRIEADRLELEPQLVYVPDICQNLIGLIQERVANHGLQFELEVDPTVEYMVADPRRLKQVLLNLLTNAIKFTLEGAIGLKVYRSEFSAVEPQHLTCDRQHDWIHFVVWDTGIGIDERDRPRLFSPFSQIDSSITRKYEGTGLGLAISRKLIELHGGWIILDSQPSRGSTFTITLPLYESDTQILLDALKHGSC